MSEVMNSYTLLEPFQNKDAGFSRWTFATRKGQTYFLKEFMNPVYPDEESLSPTLRERKIAECRNYEANRKRLYTAINNASDGNALRIFEFFRYDSHYYISTQKVEADSITMEQLAELPLDERMLLCLTASHSMMKLHEAHIVHADIKATNVLIQRSQTGTLISKIIDFDSGFLEDEPPETEDDLGGDQVYLAPEACQFICGDPIQLSCKVDVFSMGLLFHQYLTGDLPEFDHQSYDYAHEAVLDGQKLVLSNTLPMELSRILQQMLECDPQQRCSMAEVFALLHDYVYGKPLFDIVNNHPDDNKRVTPPKNPQDFFFVAGDL